MTSLAHFVAVVGGDLLTHNTCDYCSACLGVTFTLIPFSLNLYRDIRDPTGLKKHVFLFEAFYLSPLVSDLGLVAFPALNYLKLLVIF